MTPDDQRQQFLAHAAAAILFAAMAELWTIPLGQHLSTHIPGSGPGDNVASLWNFWWMRFALEHHHDPFYTGYLFAPTGTSLALHTHAALPAFAGATILRPLPLITAYNVLTIATLFLNAAASYALVYRMTRETLPSIFAGVVFGGSPFIDAHLNGHFNLLSAWTLPLVAMAAIETIRGSRRWALAAGLLCGATVYLDYYYTVYALALVAGLLLLGPRPLTLTFRPAQSGLRRLRGCLIALITLDAVVIAAVGITGGFDFRAGPISVRAHDAFNPLQVLWILIALWAWLRYRPRLAPAPIAPAHPGVRAAGTALILAVLVAIIVASPLLLRVAGLMTAGDYVSQATFWRSGAPGIDLATLFLGNPFSRWYGSWTRSAYERLAIDPIERSAWLGLAPIALAIVALRGDDRRHAVRWLIIGSVAFIWALGPHLTVLGQNTGMILPEAVLRYLPIVSNARIPGRALVVVYLALAVLSGLGLSRLRHHGLGHLGAGAIMVLVTIDFLPIPFPLVPLDRPAIYEQLRSRPEEGAVAILPMGVRDGFGETGSLDHRTLFYQSIHERPAVGGFVARLTPSIRGTYDTDALISAWLRLSAGAAVAESDLPDRTAARQSMRTTGVRFVVLDRARASSDLVHYVEQRLPLTRVADADGYSLFIVADE